MLVVLLLTAQSFPGVVRALFCAPTAWLSAQFLGVALLPAADGFRLDCPQLPVDVTLACSGTTFFAFLLVLLTVDGMRPKRARPAVLVGASLAESAGVGKRRPYALAGILLAYAITLAANTARIVLGWHAAVWAQAALPVSFHSGVHLAVGIVVFSGFLVAAALALQWNVSAWPPAGRGRPCPTEPGWPKFPPGAVPKQRGKDAVALPSPLTISPSTIPPEP